MTAKLKIAPKEDTLGHLLKSWAAAKLRETKANSERLAIEEGIVKMLPKPDDKNTATESVNGWKVTVSYGVTVKVDTEALQSLWDRLPDTAHKAFRWKAEANMVTINGLRELAPNIYATIVPVIETKPRKPSVTVEQAE